MLKIRRDWSLSFGEIGVPHGGIFLLGIWEEDVRFLDRLNQRKCGFPLGLCKLYMCTMSQSPLERLQLQAKPFRQQWIDNGLKRPLAAAAMT